jgi:hypothetical protein
VVPEELVLQAPLGAGAGGLVVVGARVGGVVARVVAVPPPAGRLVVAVVPPGDAATEVDDTVGSIEVLVDDVEEVDDVELLLVEVVDDPPSARTSWSPSPPPVSADAAVRSPTTAIAATRPASMRPRPSSDVHQERIRTP